MTGSAGPRPLEERIAVLEAVAAIERLKYRYWRACDRKDVSAFRGCFVTSGADIDFERVGRYDDADGLADVFARVALSRDDEGRHRWPGVRAPSCRGG